MAATYMQSRRRPILAIPGGNIRVAMALMGLYRADTPDRLLDAAAIAGSFRSIPEVKVAFREICSDALRREGLTFVTRLEAAFKQGVTSDSY
jgi:hypothetical protein